MSLRPCRERRSSPSRPSPPLARAIIIARACRGGRIRDAHPGSRRVGRWASRVLRAFASSSLHGLQEARPLLELSGVAARGRDGVMEARGDAEGGTLVARSILKHGQQQKPKMNAEPT